MSRARKKLPLLGVDRKHSVIAKPLAAYRLGYLSFMLRYWQQLFWDNPLLNSAEVSVFLAMEQLDDALIALADEVHPGVLNEIRRELKIFDKFHDKLIAARDSGGTYYDLEFGEGTVPGRCNWRSLRSLVERAFLKSNDLVHWLRLGTGIGRFFLELHEEDDADSKSGWMEIVKVCNCLPAAYRQQIPVLQKIADCSPRVSPIRSLQKVLKMKLLPPVDGNFRLYGLSRALFALDVFLQKRIGQVELIKPHWDGGSRKLFYGEILCKQYMRPAPHQEKILESFEELNWPEKMDDPLAPGKLPDTIKDLQKTFRGSPITFGRDGSGKRITWRAV